MNAFSFIIVTILRSLLLLLLFSSVACAYRWGFGDRTLPGGYKQISVPIFKNLSNEVGIEVDFTNALIQRIEVSKVATLSDSSVAPVVLEGKITNVEVVRGLGASSVENLPERAVLSSEYLIRVRADVRLIRQSDQKTIWSGGFGAEKVYLAPRLGTPVVNSANALYNQSARRDTIRLLAEEIMSEAHDRMTENF